MDIQNENDSESLPVSHPNCGFYKYTHSVTNTLKDFKKRLSNLTLLLIPLQFLKSTSADGKESVCNAGDSGLIPDLEDPLEKGMATHSSILVWEIPWTEEPGRLQSTGLQRVRHA